MLLSVISDFARVYFGIRITTGCGTAYRQVLQKNQIL